MKSLKKQHSNLLEETIVKFHEENINYVVLRKYENLPEKAPDKDGGSYDIDILIHPNNKDDTKRVMKQLGFSYGIQEKSKQHFGIYIKALKNPKKAIRYVISNPRKSKNLVMNNSGEYKFHYHHGELLLDFVTEIRYKSPTGGMIRVNPKIREKLLERREINSNFLYTPSPADELAHLVSHCLFDREGQFSNYYKNRCSDLVDIIKESAELSEQFKEILSWTFFAASEFMYSEIMAKNFDELLGRLKSYSDY